MKEGPSPTASPPSARDAAAAEHCLRFIEQNLTQALAYEPLRALLPLVERLAANLQDEREAELRETAAATARELASGAAPEGTVEAGLGVGHIATQRAAASPAPVGGATGASGSPTVDAVRLPAGYLSRPLYPNPVCFLTTWAKRRLNVMTVSWLSPLDNQGSFTLSINQRRFSAKMLAANPTFTLSVATAGMEDTLRSIGRLTGHQGEKLSKLGVQVCRPGWAPIDAPAKGPGLGKGAAPAVISAASEERSGGYACVDSGSEQADWPSWNGHHEQVVAALPGAVDEAVAITACAAHIVATVELVRPIHGHHLLYCRTLSAFVRRDYWSGKTMEPAMPCLPPILTFFGSQRFGHVSSAMDRKLTPQAYNNLSTPAIDRPEGHDPVRTHRRNNS